MTTPLEQQRSTAAPLSDALDPQTNALSIPIRAVDRLRNFPEEIYTLAPETHLMRLMGTLMGDAGAGQLRKRALFRRMEASLSGAHFLDLDRFWGALFSAPRAAHEQLSFNPYGETGTPDEWRELHIEDTHYRTKIQQLANAFTWGGTTTGIELASEAILGADVDVFEAFSLTARKVMTWDEFTRKYGTWDAAEESGLTWFEATSGGQDASDNNPRRFIVIPKREITSEERYDLIRVLNRLRPADSLMTIDPNGVDVHSPVALRRVVADSNHWRVKAEVLNNDLLSAFYQRPATEGQAQEQPRPPFSNYQGEAWSYVSEISGLRSTGSQKVTWYDNTTHTYLEKEAFLTTVETVSGRLASDGIVAAHMFPSLRIATNRGNLPVTPLYLDGMGTSALSSAFAHLSRPQDLTQSNRMWATYPHPMSYTTPEWIEASFPTPKRINYISMETAHYPHHIEIQAMVRGSWQTVMQTTIGDASPRSTKSLVDTHQKIHPQHPADQSHWVKIGGKITPITTDRIRVTLTRVHGLPLLDLKKKEVPYSLALRKIDIGYRVSSINDVPRDSQKFAVSADALGSSVAYSLAEDDASNLLSDTDASWVSDFQPSQVAVVNLYADIRDALGNGSTIDRFYLDPVYAGASLHLYYSNDDPPVAFVASDDDIPNHLVTRTGNIIVHSDSIEFPSSGPGTVTISNEALHWDKTKPWWTGIQFSPQHPSDDAQIHPIINLGSNSIAFFGDTLMYVDPLLSTSLTFPGLVFNEQSSFTILMAYLPVDSPDYEAGIHFWLYQDGRYLQHQMTPITQLVGIDESITIGDTHYYSGTLSPAFKLTAFVLKSEEIKPDTVTQFLNIPQQYIKKPEYRSQEDFTKNSVVRFLPEFISAGPDMTGFLGGPGLNVYEGLTWTPIPRDYSVTKGYVHVPPTMARFWKFEFTNLTPVVMESMVPVTKTVKVHPLNVQEASKVTVGGSTDQHGIDVQSSLALQMLPFADQRRYMWTPRPVRDGSSYLPTEVLVATDPARAESLRRTAWQYSYQSWQPKQHVPFFNLVSKHQYTEMTVSHSGKVGYVVGLKALKAFRVNYLMPDTQDVYLEHFNDLDFIESLGE